MATKARARAASERGTGRYDRSLSSEERFSARHERLLGVAAEVFAKHGYAGASLNEIVSKAGVSKRTFYEHFDDLRACLIAVYEHAVTSLRIADKLDDIEDPVERLTVGIERYLELMAKNAALLQVYAREGTKVLPELGAMHRRSYDRWTALIVEGASRAKHLGLTTREPDEVTAYGLVCAIEGVALRYVDRGETDRMTEAAPMLSELVLRAFR